MSCKMLFLIGAPRSGTTMLERILSAHSMIHGGPEPHILTPLAHTGVWRNVEKAPYDHIIASIGQKSFIKALSGKETVYWRACRAYCDVLYNAYMEGSGKTVCLDKTPEYATILPFIAKVFPDAKYIVLTRHPLAIFSSFANSFFDGNYKIAQEHDPLLLRYVPALAQFIRQQETSFIHVRYEDFIEDPQSWIRRIYQYLELPEELGSLEYSKNLPEGGSGLGDPLGVKRHSRPSMESLSKWADELIADSDKRLLVETMVAQLDPDDLTTIGYPLDSFWQPLQNHSGRPIKPKANRLSRYRIERKLIVQGRELVRRFPLLKQIVAKARLACDVLLREK